jgi:uncharacterized protein (TIGR02996 family)
MSHHEAFLQAILETPEDDVSRLVFADWLEDHGDPERAEFIRVQCRLAALDGDELECRELWRREYELLADHWGEWTAPLVGRVSHWEFRRGFVEQIKASGRQFLKGAKLLLTFAPICEVEVKYPDKDEFRKLCGSRYLRRILRLGLDFARIGDEGVALLADCPNVGQLTDLSLRWNELTTAGLLTVARSPRLQALRSVRFYESDKGRCDDADFRAFVTACRLPALERLEWDEQVSPKSIRALLNSPVAGQLKSLSLNRIGSAGIHLLADSNALAQLEVLEVAHGEDVDAEAMAHLAASPLLRRLTSLMFKLLRLGDDGAGELARAPAGSLRHLSLQNNRIGPNGARALAASPLCRALTRLDLSGNAIGDAGLRALTHLDHLRWLDVGRGTIGRQGVKSLLASPLLERLSYLGVEKNEIGLRAFENLRARLGDRLEHELLDAGLDSDEIIRRVRAEPPRCLRGLGAKTDTELIRRFPRQRIEPLEYASIAFELTPPDPEQRTTLLGYEDHRGYFFSPYALRWEPSGQQREFFDAEQHGLGGENGVNCTTVGWGKRIPWKCGHRGCRDHQFVATFIYAIEVLPTRSQGRHLPFADQFYHFDLDAYCPTEDKMINIASFECK